MNRRDSICLPTSGEIIENAGLRSLYSSKYDRFDVIGFEGFIEREGTGPEIQIRYSLIRPSDRRPARDCVKANAI